MVRLRFLRIGKKHQPFFRLVATDRRTPPKGGRFLEILGSFNPRSKQKYLKTERIKYWLSVGAQPSSRVHNLLVAEGILDAAKLPLHKRSKQKKQVKAETEARPESESNEKEKNNPQKTST